MGLPDDEDDFDFNERFTSLKAEFEAQLAEKAKLHGGRKTKIQVALFYYFYYK